MSLSPFRLVFCGWFLLSGAAAAQAPEADAKDDAPLPAGRVRLVLDTGGHTLPPERVCFTPDGAKLVSASHDRTVQIWDVASGRRLHVLRPALGKGEFGTPDFLVLDRQGKNLAFAVLGRDAKGVVIPHAGYVMVCAIDTGALRCTAPGHGRLAFAPDGQRLAVAGDRHVRLRNVATGKESLKPIPVVPAGVKATIYDLAYSPDGKILAVSAHDKVYLLDPATLATQQVLSAANPLVKLERIAWANDQTLLATGTPRQGSLHVWDVPNQKLLKVYTALQTMPNSPKKATSPELRGLDPIPGTTQVLLLGNLAVNNINHTGGIVFDWAAGTAGKEHVEKTAGNLKPKALAVTVGKETAKGADRMLAAQGSAADGAIVLWDPATGAEVSRLQGVKGGAAYRGARWRRDGKAIAWGLVDEADPAKRAFAPLRQELDVTTLDQQTKTEADFKDYPNDVELGRLKTAGERTARLKDSKTIEISNGKKSVEITKGTATIDPYAWTFVDAGHLVLTSIGSGTLDVVDPATGKVLRRRRLTQTRIGSVALAPATAKHPLLLVGSHDRTLTIYNAVTDEILLTVYPAGGDWIAWTPEGYYAATRGGERLVGWQIDRGPDKLASFYPVERLRKRLWRPDVIKLVLDKGSVAEALKAADAARGERESKQIDVENLLPPQVHLAIVDASKLPNIKVKATAAAGAKQQPITALRLLLDGRPLPEGAGMRSFADKPEEKATAEWTVTLPSGTHQLAVLARSPDSSAISPPVECTNAKVVNPPALHVLTVGVNQYKNGIPPLKFAVADAKSIAKAFRANKAGPFAPAAVRELLDKQARRDDVLGALARLRADVKPNDLVVVHFAGHGVKDKDGFYLLTVDADPQKLATTAVSGAELRKVLGEFPCQVLLLLDACHSGGAIKNFRPVVDDLTRVLSDDESGVAVLSAAMGSELAQEKDGKGLFSRAVVDVLTKKAGIPFNRHDKQIYIHHLHSYVFDEVARLSNQRQHPALSLPSVVESFPIRNLKVK